MIWKAYILGLISVWEIGNVLGSGSPAAKTPQSNVAPSGSPATPQDQTPKGAARYTIDLKADGSERKLGDGAAGVTYLATDTVTNAKVVIKKPLDKESGRKALLREYHITKQLSHPGIPKVIDFYYETPNKPVLVLEYIKGGDIFDLTHKKPDTALRARTPLIIAKLLSILHYLHERKVGHLDVHGANVMVTSDDRVVLIDYGEAMANMEPLRGLKGQSRSNYYFLDPDARDKNQDFGMAVDYFGVALILHKLWHPSSEVQKYFDNKKHSLGTGDKDVDELIDILKDRDHARRWRNCFVKYPVSFQSLAFFKNITDWSQIDPELNAKVVHSPVTPYSKDLDPSEPKKKTSTSKKKAAPKWLIPFVSVGAGLFVLGAACVAIYLTHRRRKQLANTYMIP